MAESNELVPILNPLLVYVVVKNLFEYLPLKDIIKQRRICKLWQQIGLERLKKDIDLIEISFDPEKTIDKFLEMGKGFSFKFRNFVLRYWNDGSNDDVNEQTNRLFEEYGTHMKVIALNLFDSTNSWTFLSDVLVNKAPNIERLRLERYLQRSKATGLFSEKTRPKLNLKHLTLVWQKDANEPMNFQALLADLFACSPCLETLTVAFVINEVMNLNNYGIVAILKVLAQEGNISNLKTLTLNVEDDDIFKILATSFKSAPLESVSYGIYEIDLEMLPYIETFFGDHKDTLKELNITFPCVDFLNKFPFPIMNNLVVLSIYGWCFNDSEVSQHRVPFGVFNFGKVFPNLLTLCLYEHIMTEGDRFFNLEEMFPEDTTPLLSLKNLDLPPISNPAILRRMKRIFPNVLKLKLASLTPAVLRELWTTWPGIKTLNISLIRYPCYRFVNLDSIFTGVNGGDHSRNFPSISHLRKLKHLRIDGGGYPLGSANARYIKIKDETAYLALAEMKELVLLQISSDRHEISSSCVQYLCSELGMLKTETKVEDRALQLVKYEWQKRSWCPAYLDYE